MFSTPANKFASRVRRLSRWTVAGWAGAFPVRNSQKLCYTADLAGDLLTITTLVADAVTVRVGEIFAGYEIVGTLGAGGMGAVYLARHPRLPREDALKILLPAASTDAEFRARFLREAELAARLRHPNIVAIHDRGESEGCLWIAMQYVPGKDASNLGRGGSTDLPPWRAVHIITEAAHGLDAAHDAGLLHRDVKPANILISTEPNGADRVLVTDFGIARAVGESTVLTAEGEVLATVAYAAPEQISAATVGHRADVYALGGTLYYLLTGDTPFPRPTPAAVMYSHLYEPPPRPSSKNPLVPREFDDVIARAMAKDPADRYPSCGALALAAAAALRGELDPVVPPGRPRIGKRKAVLALSFAVLLCATAGVVVWRATSQEPTTAPVTTQGAAPPTTSAADPSGPWGEYGFVIGAFPDLLPPTPIDNGYRGIHCQTMEIDKTSETPGIQSAPLDVVPDVVAAISCVGDRDPLSELFVACSVDRLPVPQGILATIFEGATATESWTRSTGGGTLQWGQKRNPNGVVVGQLLVGFDSSERNFCQLVVLGELATGQNLHDSWWPDAPI